MSRAAQSEISELLERAGARPRGTRHDCPKCAGPRTLTHTGEVFYCHRCQWKGGLVSLAKELGVYQRISPAEYREQCRKRERAGEAAERLAAVVYYRRMQLLNILDRLRAAERAAHALGPDCKASWDAVEMIHLEKPLIEGELDFLESSSPDVLVRYFASEGLSPAQATCSAMLPVGSISHSSTA